MSKPAARITDMHVCPKVNPGPVPHVGGPVAQGSTDVFIGGLPAARVGDKAICVGPPDSVSGGSSTVLINGKQAARMGDRTAHGGILIIGCPTVLIGDSGGGGQSAGAQASAGKKPDSGPESAVAAGATQPAKSLEQKIEESQQAFKRAQDTWESLPKTKQNLRRTVASDGIKTVSGWTKKGSFNAAKPEDVAKHSEKIGHKLSENSLLDQTKKGGFPGKYNASHAEKQLIVKKPNEPIGVAPRKMCNDCQEFFKKEAAYRGEPQVVTDCEVTRIFYPDGTFQKIPHSL